jgi:two-component system OmpR family sensor kinase
VDDVLLSARLEAGAADFPVRRAPVDLAALLERARRRFAERHPGRALELELAGGPLVADGALLGRVIDNLLENAARHGGPHVALRARVGERLRVEVADDGPGLAPADRERVFEPFFRADASRARATGGVGLGLSLCRAIVRAHGGEIGALPRDGGGVVFWVEVPASA